MKAFYENYRDEENTIRVHRNRSHLYPAHYHRNLEVFILKKGFYSLTVNDVTYDLSAGSILVIDSFDVHSYDFRDNTPFDDCVLLIPYEFRQFLIATNSQKIVCPVIKNGSLAGELIEIIEKYMSETGSVQSGALTLILSLISKHLTFSLESEKDDATLIRKILTFIQSNYRADVSRGTIAKSLGYTESYISHVFHRYVKVSISEYVNRLRLIYVKNQLLNNQKKTVNEIIYEAGFKSQQTYYRVKSLYGLPSENSLWKYR